MTHCSLDYYNILALGSTPTKCYIFHSCLTSESLLYSYLASNSCSIDEMKPYHCYHPSYCIHMSKGRKLHRSIVRQLKKEQETSPLSSPMFIHPIVDQLQQGQRSKFKVLALLHAASLEKLSSFFVAWVWGCPVFIYLLFAFISSVLPSFADGHMYDLSTIPRVSYLPIKTYVWCLTHVFFSDLHASRFLSRGPTHLPGGTPSLPVAAHGKEETCRDSARHIVLQTAAREGKQASLTRPL